ncbi:hypothetical protein CYLTODRAFT_494743 [Cylindrobasidium torrendii FP15055 ss-10]|uniref:Nucleoplasmin-like domain-containing protein n=1 Tax=Cylindrobasidium torrendii FP15055 ss-10 TaxID=1314674 RepID=A0A0D7AV78_9AGAR|nr:hypothetical protein CYLTODRAFT_494743 [Cylindrobasidium torrendii FP15055 ss-10]
MAETKFWCEVPSGSWGITLNPGDGIALNHNYLFTRVITSIVLLDNSSPNPSIVTLSWQPDPDSVNTQSVVIARLLPDGAESCFLNFPLAKTSSQYKCSVTGQNRVYIHGYSLVDQERTYRSNPKRGLDDNQGDEREARRSKV